MKSRLKSLLVGAAGAVSLFVLSANPVHAENLAEKLEEAGLGAIIGTWVDADSNGETVTVTYAWKIKDHAIGISVKTPDGHSEAMVAVDPESGEVVQVSVDEKGGLAKGKWGEEDGLPTLKIKRIAVDGTSREVHVSHKLRDNKELVVGMKNPETGEGGEITLVRKAE